MIDRRSEQASFASKPSAHDFRRALALNMLRNGADVFALKKLMGHSDLQIMRRYLVQNNPDTQLAHLRGSSPGLPNSCYSLASTRKPSLSSTM